MKKYLILTIFCICGCLARAQQIPLYNQYYINPFVYNPSMAGTAGDPNLYFIHHTQWANFPGAPVTNALTFDTPIQRNKLGIGATFSNDNISFLTRTEIMAALSYRVKLNADNSVLFGLAGGIINNQIDFSKIQAADLTESSIYSQVGRGLVPNATFGVTYQYRNLEIGAAVPQLLGSKITYANEFDTRTYYTLVRHYLGSFKYKFDINPHKGITAYPMVLIHTAAANVPVETDFSAVLNWTNTGWAAISYRSSSSIGLNIGVLYKGFTIGYSYEVPTGTLAGMAGNSNEILIGYTFSRHPVKDKLDFMIKKIDKIEKQAKETNERIDSVESKAKAMTFEQVDALKRDLQAGDLLMLKNVTFEYKSTQLTEKSYDILDELVTLLERNPSMKIAIYGHTDDVGSDDYNNKLSEQRAKVVYQYLVDGGIKESRLSYKGLGRTQPIKVGTSERDRARNRRVEFKVISR